MGSAAPVPSAYMAQVQWQMACTGRQWCDLASYQPMFPAAMQLVVRRIERNDGLIEELEAQVTAFLDEVDNEYRVLMTAYDPMRAFQDAHAFLEAAE
jgi:predicted phage-related endonuclease